MGDLRLSGADIAREVMQLCNEGFLLAAGDFSDLIDAQLLQIAQTAKIGFEPEQFLYISEVLSCRNRSAHQDTAEVFRTRQTSLVAAFFERRQFGIINTGIDTMDAHPYISIPVFRVCCCTGAEMRLKC